MGVSYSLDRKHDYRKKYLKEIELKKKEFDDDYKDIIDEKEKQNMKLRLQLLDEIKVRIENYNKVEKDD